LIGKRRDEVMSKDAAEQHEANDREVIKAGQALEFEEYGTFQGRAITFLTIKFPLYDARGRIYAVAGISGDISDRKNAEEVLKRDRETFERLVQERTAELVNAQMQLERAKRLSDIGVLAATVAHELRNPLAAIGMAAHNIRRKVGSPDIERHLANIDKKVAESDQIINNLLFYSRLRPPHYESVNILDTLEESIESTGAKHRKSTSIIRDIDALRGISIEADPIQVREVLNNILDNAFDAVHPETGAIKIVSENDDEFVKITIKDNGRGIDKDDLERVFDPFFSTKAKGTGLGLSVCRQIVNLHDGTIGIESESGQGTTVVVCLPKERKRG
jgi:signal transduction histidine kinase